MEFRKDQPAGRWLWGHKILGEHLGARLNGGKGPEWRDGRGQEHSLMRPHRPTYCKRCWPRDALNMWVLDTGNVLWPWYCRTGRLGAVALTEGHGDSPNTTQPENHQLRDNRLGWVTTICPDDCGNQVRTH